MRVGDYVRTENGLIGKIIDFKGDMVETDNKRLITYKSNHNEIIDSNPNIIGLIKVGDYVNGYYVEDITNTGEELVLHIITGSNYFQSPFLYNEDIKSVLTHEQFEATKYVVGEE